MNALLLVALLALVYSGGGEFSVRRYLDGFSDAIVPDSQPAERQVEALCASAFALVVFLVLRIVLGWYADQRLKIPRFQLRSQFIRAGTTFFRAPEIN